MSNSLETSQSSSLAVGSVVELGHHRLLVGDCLDAALVGQFLHGEQIDLLLTDPPYGIAYVEGKTEFTGSKSHRPIANDGEQSEANYRRFTRDWLFADKDDYTNSAKIASELIRRAECSPEWQHSVPPALIGIATYSYRNLAEQAKENGDI